jgi:hypothetical protein
LLGPESSNPDSWHASPATSRCRCGSARSLQRELSEEHQRALSPWWMARAARALEGAAARDHDAAR